MEGDDDYNVNNYTDNELYDILELVNPSDSILEAKIIQMINRYNSINNRYGKRLVEFFTNIYKHFFDVPNESSHEGFENIESIRYDRAQGRFITDTDAPKGIALERNSNPDSKEPPSELTSRSNIQVQQMDYAKGGLNPLLKQTIKRIISIDSQYRETQDFLSSEFTFNLSEPLRDVVALRLYSVQIPFTWYTIGNNYGANYIFLKGNSPGIDTGDFDYQIEIAPGNYTNQTLVDEINNEIPNVRAAYTDISFGTTGITYDVNACKSTITIDIKNLYNESDYQLVFPNEPTLNKYPLFKDPNIIENGDDELRYSTQSATSTLSAYLGFNNQSYRINTIYSDTNNMNDSTYISVVNYILNATNNSFTISRETRNRIKIDDDIIITLPERSYSAKGILDAVNTAFSMNDRFDSTLSKLTRGFVTDPNKENYNLHHYEMQIYFNKKTDRFSNVTALTTYITFPNETTSNVDNIWTGINSLFKFKNKIEYTNIIFAESQSYQTDYLIDSSPYIVLKCMKPGFTSTDNYEPNQGSHSIPDALSNDFIIDISNNTLNNGYNFTSYLNEISTKMQQLNSSPKLFYHNSIFENNIEYNEITNRIFFTFNMNIEFNQTSYKINFGNVFTVLEFSNNPNPNLDFELTSTKINFTSYSFATNEVLATIYPKSTSKNYADAPWVIMYTGAPVTFTIFENLRLFIKSQFDNFIIPNSDIQPITLNITFNTRTVGNNTETNIILNFSIIRILIENDYHVIFHDAIPRSSLSWNANLFFDASYNLSDPNDVSILETSTIITSNREIAGYTFFMDNPATFTLAALTNGVNSLSGANNVVINIPKPVSGNLYTRQEILNIINTQLDANPLTFGSKIESYVSPEPNPTNKQFIRMQLKINKLFTASDYKLVFYDQLSFVKCFVGTKSVRNVTLDSTLGWILGFRSNTEFDFNSNDFISNPNEYAFNIYKNISNVVSLVSDTTMTTNIYDYFLIILDDFNQSHLNDGLVTIVPKDMSIPLPSYAQTISCNANGNTLITDSTGNVNNLTEKQLYAANSILNERKAAKKSFSTGPYVQDVFGLIPLKLNLDAGLTYVEFGGTLQNQERVYFGPVNISRMSIKLIDDRGDPVDLNGANWSFSFICEQLYNLNERSK